MDLFVAESSSRSDREKLMTEWYRSELKSEIPPLVKKWQEKTDIGIDEWRVKDMKTKWGSCTPEKRRIWVNLKLIQKPLHHLEYIILHEILHIEEDEHSKRFENMLDKFMTRWRLYRDELNDFILSYEEWKE